MSIEVIIQKVFSHLCYLICSAGNFSFIFLWCKHFCSCHFVYFSKTFYL